MLPADVTILGRLFLFLGCCRKRLRRRNLAWSIVGQRQGGLVASIPARVLAPRPHPALLRGLLAPGWLPGCFLSLLSAKKGTLSKFARVPFALRLLFQVGCISVACFILALFFSWFCWFPWGGLATGARYGTPYPGKTLECQRKAQEPGPAEGESCFLV